MDFRPHWLVIWSNVFAVVGVIAVLGFGIAGLRKLALRRAAVRDTSKSQAAASAAVSVATSATSSSPPAPSPQPQPAPAPIPAPQSSPSSVRASLPDLSVRIVDTGVIDVSTDKFRHADSIGQGDQPAIVFEVLNSGGSRSESWKFSATLPTFAGFYSSETQRPLDPGERVRFTIGFRDLLRQGENQAVITLDPMNSLKDANRANDVATAVLRRNY